MTTTCQECERKFNLSDENDASEWYYGHDCEVGDIMPDKSGYPRTGLKTASFGFGE